MFWHGELHTLVIQSTTLFVLVLQSVTWAGTYSIDEVHNLTITFPTVNAPFEISNVNQGEKMFAFLCLDANRCKRTRRKINMQLHFYSTVI